MARFCAIEVVRARLRDAQTHDHAITWCERQVHRSGITVSVVSSRYMLCGLMLHRELGIDPFDREVVGQRTRVLDFDLRACMEEFAELLALRVQEKGVEFVCAIDPNIHTHLQGDPGRLRQILINLTGNAIKFTSEGEVVVRVTIDSESEKDVLLR